MIFLATNSEVLIGETEATAELTAENDTKKTHDITICHNNGIELTDRALLT